MAETRRKFDRDFKEGAAIGVGFRLLGGRHRLLSVAACRG